jgi:hypothetical protein
MPSTNGGVPAIGSTGSGRIVSSTLSSRSAQAPADAKEQQAN